VRKAIENLLDAEDYDDGSYGEAGRHAVSSTQWAAACMQSCSRSNEQVARGVQQR
jgi:hypothetical protein